MMKMMISLALLVAAITGGSANAERRRLPGALVAARAKQVSIAEEQKVNYARMADSTLAALGAAVAGPVRHFCVVATGLARAVEIQ